MKIGDKVKFVGDLEGYTVAGQRVLKRTGEIVQTEPSNWLFLRKGAEVRVKWLPKTKRGYPEFYRHKITELEVIV